jgi:enoyl-CoA hydratase
VTALTLEVTDSGVATVTIDRPPVNALNTELRTTLLSTLDALHERDDVRAIVLTATGHVFCAGADIKEKATLTESSPGDYARANRLTKDLFFALLDNAKPVIAAVNGHALGAGFVIAGCCDMIFAADAALFAMPEIDVGQGGGASFLQRIMPLGKLHRMMLTGERVPAAELYRLGVIEASLPADEVLGAALEVAEKIAEKDPGAVRAIRQSYTTVAALNLEEGVRVEQIYTTGLARSDAGAAARDAFLAGRARS